MTTKDSSRFTVITNHEINTTKKNETNIEQSYHSNPMYEKLMNFRNLQEQQKKRFSVDDLFKLCWYRLILLYHGLGMYQIKSRIYLDFDKTQKTGLCNYIRALVKQNLDLTCSEILDKFFEDEKYYLELNSSRFPFLENYIDEESFYNDTKLYINECIKYYNYKESQKPFIEKQKEFEKKKRKFLQEVKMSKELPTKKQLYYYDKLCKRYNINKKDEEGLSKLDLKNEIERILNEHSNNNSNLN